MNDPNAEMHKRSGAVHATDPLIALFYDLLRDHISPGVLEQLVREACLYDTTTKVYSNGWLAQYATDLVFRLDVARNKPNQSSTPVLK
jgi:hypothetical protein